MIDDIKEVLEYFKDWRMWVAVTVMAAGLLITEAAWAMDWDDVEDTIVYITDNMKPIEFTVKDVDFKYYIYRLDFDTQLTEDVSLSGGFKVNEDLDYKAKALITITF
jgi:hypothetical protein